MRTWCCDTKNLIGDGEREHSRSRSIRSQRQQQQRRRRPEQSTYQQTHQKKTKMLRRGLRHAATSATTASVVVGGSSSATMIAPAGPSSSSSQTTPLSQQQQQQQHQQHSRPRRHHHPSKNGHRNDANIRHSDNSPSTVLVTPAPPPVLLLEGDPYLLSSGGIARSVYRLPLCDQHNSNDKNSSSSSSSSCSINTIESIEEIYDIEKYQKSFVIHTKNGSSNGDGDGDSLSPSSWQTRVTIKELNDDDIGGFGTSFGGKDNGINVPKDRTGQRTWDSSLVMTLYLASHPEILQGKDVIELGSGVGLGGILTSYVHCGSYKSLTLTDYNPRILNQCKENIQRRQQLMDPQEVGRHDTNFLESSSIPPFLTMEPPSAPLRVERLDWYDFLSMTGNALEFEGRYDTVLACDCAYRYEDLDALSTTMMKLLRSSGQDGDVDIGGTSTDDSRPSIHIFGPETRGGLIGLISHLKQFDNLHVKVESLGMTKGRIDPEISSPVELSQTQYTFLHVECTLKQKDDSETTQVVRMEDID